MKLECKRKQSKQWKYYRQGRKQSGGVGMHREVCEIEDILDPAAQRFEHPSRLSQGQSNFFLKAHNLFDHNSTVEESWTMPARASRGYWV